MQRASCYLVTPSCTTRLVTQPCTTRTVTPRAALLYSAAGLAYKHDQTRWVFLGEVCVVVTVCYVTARQKNEQQPDTLRSALTIITVAGNRLTLIVNETTQEHRQWKTCEWSRRQLVYRYYLMCEVFQHQQTTFSAFDFKCCSYNSVCRQ